MSSSKPAAVSSNPKPQDPSAPKEDLWEQALAKLSVEDRKQYVDSSSSPGEVLKKGHAVPGYGINQEPGNGPGKKTMLTGVRKFKVHEATENTKEACLAKGWRVYRKKNGDEVKLRHVLEKLSKWVEEAIKLVDLGVSFDQSGHSALPWGIVKFLVTTGKSNVDVFINVVEGVESVSSLITRYTIVESLYLSGSNEATRNLRESIIEFYSAILTYLARAKSFFSGSTIKQIGRGLIEAAREHYNVTKISESNVQHWMRLVDAGVYRDTAKREIEHYDSLQGILLALNRPITRMTSQLDDLQDHFNSEKRREVFRWMSEIEYKSHHEDLSKGLLPESGQWLLDHKHFIQWGQSSVSSILWLHGIPGSGKTRLVSRIIDVMLDERKAGQSPTAFFYCARSTAEPERGKPAEILGAILRQLCSSKPDRPIRGPVAKEYELRSQKANEDCSRVRKLSVEDCRRLILELTEDNPATIIIDALDECEEETRHELLETLDIVISRSTELVRVIVSSRDDVDITLRLDGCKNISISAHCNGGDIKRFVVSEVDRLISKKLLLDGNIKKDLKLKLIGTLTSGAQGMFRWVAMSLETLQSIKFRPDFERLLGQLPSKLSGLYDIIHSQIDMTESYGRDTAIRTLKWLLCAQRLMSAKEVIAAVTLPSESTADAICDSDDDFSKGKSVENSIEEDLESWSHSDEIRKDDIIRSCRNLVAVDAQHEYFRFAHQSVREYLLIREEYTIEEQHALAAERCLDVYLTETWPDLINPNFLRRNAHLKSYSRFYWPVHYKYVEEFGSQALERKILAFMIQGSTTSPAYLKWASEIEHFQYHIFHELNNGYLHSGLVFASEEPKTYLSALCAFGFSSLMKDQGLSFLECNQLVYSSYLLPKLLNIASERGHYQIVEMLLGRRFDVNAWIDGLSALHKASREGHESIVKILLDHGAYVDLNEDGNTPLLLASIHGHVSVVKILLEKGADFNLEVYKDRGSPLENAVNSGHDPIVQLLLRHGADVNPQSRGRQRTALHTASENGHESIVQMLLKHGADIDARDDMGRRALHLVSQRVYELEGNAFDQASMKITQLLLDHGAEVNARDFIGNSSLHISSEQGHASIVKLLIGNGADVNARDQWDNTSLHNASKQGNASIVRLLIGNGADVNARNFMGNSSLHNASKQGHDSIVHLLIGNGADVNAQDTSGNSSLHEAYNSGISVMQLLLDHGADVNARNREGRSPLDLVRISLFEPRARDMIQFLLDHGAVDTPPTPERDRTRLEVVPEDFGTEEVGAEDNTASWIQENHEDKISENDSDTSEYDSNTSEYDFRMSLL